MKRALAVIDGLNLHHALKMQKHNMVNLDLLKLCAEFKRQRNVDEMELIYFTSVIRHIGKSVEAAQHRYLDLLRASGVQIKFGEFRSSVNKCPECGFKSRTHKEKQTDVALATEVTRRVFTEEITELFIFSADTDFLPVVKTINEHKPSVSVTLVSTVEYLRPMHGALSRLGARTIRLSPELVAKYQFDEI